MLQMLEEADLVASTTTGNKRLYAITEAGRDYVASHRAELDTINAQLDRASGDIRDSAIGEEVHALRTVLRETLRSGALTTAQSERLRQIIRQARPDIEAL